MVVCLAVAVAVVLGRAAAVVVVVAVVVWAVGLGLRCCRVSATFDPAMTDITVTTVGAQQFLLDDLTVDDTEFIGVIMIFDADIHGSSMKATGLSQFPEGHTSDILAIEVDGDSTIDGDFSAQTVITANPGHTVTGTGSAFDLNLNGADFTPTGCFNVVNQLLFPPAGGLYTIDITDLSRCTDYTSTEVGDGATIDVTGANAEIFFNILELPDDARSEFSLVHCLGSCTITGEFADVQSDNIDFDSILIDITYETFIAKYRIRV